MGGGRLKDYMARRAYSGPWGIAGTERTGFLGAVVIPALGEGKFLWDTLDSLAQNPPSTLARFLVLVVVNHRADVPPADRLDNLSTLQRLALGLFPPALHLAWVDAASPGRELPAKSGGVGLARKIGLDLALPRLDFTARPILVCLDADTLVSPDYLPVLLRHFREAPAGGAVAPFRHRSAQTPEEERAIQRYELFLRSYVLGLSLAHSPYDFHTVGSTMSCRAEAYLSLGGMNLRAAGEDFYFLQQLAKTAGVLQVKGTMVFPSPRPSHRVPFGTGRSVSRLLAGEKEAVLFYRPECFRILAAWLALVAENLEAGGEEIQARAGRISPFLAGFLENLRFPLVWEKLRRNYPRPFARRSAFHTWFDGFKTLKLVHHLSAGPFPRSEPEEALPALWQWAGLPRLSGIGPRLALLRRMAEGPS